MKGSDAEFDNQLKIKIKQKWLTYITGLPAHKELRDEH